MLPLCTHPHLCFEYRRELESEINSTEKKLKKLWKKVQQKEAERGLRPASAYENNLRRQVASLQRNYDQLFLKMLSSHRPSCTFHYFPPRSRL